jgi:hypothetical protein
MKNPITPITAQLSKLIKKDIDFRTAAPTLKHSGGFYFKIGTFVVSRTNSQLTIIKYFPRALK